MLRQMVSGQYPGAILQGFHRHAILTRKAWDVPELMYGWGLP